MSQEVTGNPLLVNCESSREDEGLVREAVGGSRGALEKLVRRHQRWIYNIVLRMVGNPDEALDITQEILIKMVTRLSSFRHESRFRTWLYTLVTRTVLNSKRTGKEAVFSSFENQGRLLDSLESKPSLAPEESAAERETRTACLTGMVLCLDRESRIVFILGGLFGLPNTDGAAMLEITPAAFRKRLSRSRKKLKHFMDSRCGLVDPRNPCRCSAKAQAALEAGYISTGTHEQQIESIREAIGRARTDDLSDESFAKYMSALREAPMETIPDLAAQICDTIEASRLNVN